MNIFKTTRFSWWQLAVLKWATMFFGIAIGALWSEFFTPYAVPLLVVALIAGVYLAVVWSKSK